MGNSDIAGGSGKTDIPYRIMSAAEFSQLANQTLVATVTAHSTRARVLVTVTVPATRRVAYPQTFDIERLEHVREFPRARGNARDYVAACIATTVKDLPEFTNDTVDETYGHLGIYRAKVWRDKRAADKCAYWHDLDIRFGTDKRSPLHHDNRCEIHKR